MPALTQKGLLAIKISFEYAHWDIEIYWISPDTSRNSTTVITLTLAFQNVWSSRKEFLVAPKLTLLSNVSSQIVLKMGYFLSFFPIVSLNCLCTKKDTILNLKLLPFSKLQSTSQIVQDTSHVWLLCAQAIVHFDILSET